MGASPAGELRRDLRRIDVGAIRLARFLREDAARAANNGGASPGLYRE
jgi:hypothetical protein